MIKLSIIICKYNEEVFEKCISSIEETLKGGYELVVIDNTKSTFDIFKAYNEGINKSKGEILCFIHEDVICHSYNWGKTVERHFKNDDKLGMIGIAGGASYNKFAWSWKQTSVLADNAISIIGIKNNEINHITDGFTNTSKQVLLVDGLWFCIRASTLKEHQISFDNNLYSGFHRYDYDICMQIAQVAKINVVNDIKLQHFSSGNKNKEWMASNITFQNKWSNFLPCRIEESKIGIVKQVKSKKDLKALYSFLIKMNDFNYKHSEIRKIIEGHFFLSPFQIKTQLKIIIVYLFGFKIIRYLKKAGLFIV